GYPRSSPYRVQDDVHKAEYLSLPSQNRFISFTDTWQIQQSVNFMATNGYGGMMVFPLEGEYITGQTLDARYPLSTDLYNAVTGGSGSPCDVNGDGATNALDVQQTVNQALQLTPCTADINKDGACNVIDVQRVANAVLGGACVSP